MEVIEVFKTNVSNRDQANMLIDQIHKNFIYYKANFDLEDCDKILRIKSADESIESCFVINLLLEMGFNAEVLPDEFLAYNRFKSYNKQKVTELTS